MFKVLFAVSLTLATSAFADSNPVANLTARIFESAQAPTRESFGTEIRTDILYQCSLYPTDSEEGPYGFIIGFKVENSQVKNVVTQSMGGNGYFEATDFEIRKDGLYGEYKTSTALFRVTKEPVLRRTIFAKFTEGEATAFANCFEADPQYYPYPSTGVAQ